MAQINFPGTNRPIPSSPEYATRQVPDVAELCPNCKDGFLWDRGHTRYCRQCGIEGPGLRGIVFYRASTGGVTTTHQATTVPGFSASGQSPIPISHRGDVR